MSIFTKIWDAIKSIFRGLSAAAKKIIPIADQIIENLKLIDASHIGDILTSLIPGDADDKILAKLREGLPKIINYVDLGKHFANIENENDRMKAIIAAINLSPEQSKLIFYRGMVQLILDLLADGDWSKSDSLALGEYWYQHKDELKAELEANDKPDIETQGPE